MSRHPEIAEKAYEELNSVVGLARLPVLEDRPKLPYVEAILTEAMRYGPPAPLGIPHKCLKDDLYNGYFIEKGTTVIPNIW
jgi:cytochrome P450